MKESRYNIWVERDESAYLFNGVTGALLAMPASDPATLRRFLAGDTGFNCSVELLKKLALGKMLLSDQDDDCKDCRPAMKRAATTPLSFLSRSSPAWAVISIAPTASKRNIRRS